ncbi:MAG: type II toxin-antitoxin system Phd/YefM family antitoxin [Bacteroidota bacterium]|nr:type II toxin-antitoxin system Phd/YefM family antitoxin [Bacteroidota bacterium]
MKTINEKFIVNKEGKKTEVILDINEYEQLLEDLHDLAIIVERKDEYLVDHKVVLKNLKKK